MLSAVPPPRNATPLVAQAARTRSDASITRGIVLPLDAFHAVGHVQVAGIALGELLPGHGQHLLDVGHALHGRHLAAQQQLAVGIERPRVAPVDVLGAFDAPDGRRRGLGADAAGAALQPGADADHVARVAARLHECAHRVRRLRLAQQDAVHAPRQDLPKLPGVVADHRLAAAVDRRLDDDGGRAVPARGRPAGDQSLHVVARPVRSKQPCSMPTLK